LTTLRIVALALAAVVWQTTASHWYEVGGARPDFVLVVLVAIALDGPARAGWTAAAVAGGLVDVLSLDAFGAHLGAALALVLVVRQGVRGGLGDDAIFRVPLAALGLGVAVTLRPLLHWLLAGERAALELAPQVALSTGLFALLGVPVLGRLALASASRARTSSFR